MNSRVRRIGARGAAFARGWRSPRRRHALPIVITSFLGVAFSVAGSHAIFHWADRAAELELTARGNNITGTLQAGTDEYLDRVAALRAFFKSSEHGVRRGEFPAFAQDLLRGRSAILSLSWVPRVSRDERPAHELAAARDGVVGYQIKSVAPWSQRRSGANIFRSITRPRGKDARRVLGLDLADGGVREDTLRRAREHDRFAASKLIVLYSGTGDRRGFFVSSPVYNKGLPQETIEERERNLDGFVQGVFQLDIMIQTIIGGLKAPLDVYIFASNSDPQALPIHVQSSALRASPAAPRPMAALTAGPHWISPLRVADLERSLVAVSIPTGNANGLTGWMLLGAGLLVTGIVTAFMGASARHAQMLTRANRQVSELAETDPLTNLANRRAFMHQLGASFVDPRRVEIELTESVLLEATQGHADIVARLRMLGVAIALDDFGTGYSSLNYLTKYSVDRLKIAQELVFEVTTGSRHATVVRTAIRLAEELGIDIIGEGVETAGQAPCSLPAAGTPRASTSAAP
ncbi:MAG TPA: CHASE domain-containing protein [Xanthobacteraceae bacterium]